MLFLTTLGSAYAVDSPYQPRKGWWKEMLTLLDESGKTDTVPLSRASYPETCVNSLRSNAAKIEQANGFIWTGKRYPRALSYVEQEGFDLKNEVIEFKCVFEASSDKDEKK
jgi:hypothetical protein